MAVTSRIKQDEAFGEVVVAHWQDAGLLKPSAIKPVITTIESGLVIGMLGRLDKEDITRLNHSIKKILGA